MSYKLLQDLSSNQISNTSLPQAMAKNKLASIQVVYSNLTPAAKSFVDADVSVANDTVTITAHGFSTGVLGRLSSTGTLPAGLAAATDYFIIKVDANTIKFATSHANALAGTAVDITGAIGTGTHTFTPTALNASFKLQASGDNLNWVDIAGTTVAISASGTTLLNLVDFAEPLFRAVLTQTSGQGVLDLKVHTHLKK